MSTRVQDGRVRVGRQLPPRVLASWLTHRAPVSAQRPRRPSRVRCSGRRGAPAASIWYIGTSRHRLGDRASALRRTALRTALAPQRQRRARCACAASRAPPPRSGSRSAADRAGCRARAESSTPGAPPRAARPRRLALPPALEIHVGARGLGKGARGQQHVRDAPHLLARIRSHRDHSCAPAPRSPDSAGRSASAQGSAFEQQIAGQRLSSICRALRPGVARAPRRCPGAAARRQDSAPAALPPSASSP